MLKENEDFLNQLREKAKKISEIQGKVDICQNIEDYMEQIPDFRNINLNETNFTISSFSELPDSYEPWAFALLIRNMRDIYQKSWKWDEEAKRDELLNTSSRFLIAFKDGRTPAAFIHFRFEQLDGDFVIYIYDVQVDSAYKETNIRKLIIQAVELIGLKNKVDACVTFVFKADTEYMELLTKMNYRYHHTSPSVFRPDHPEQYKHEIMFKPLVSQK